MTRATNQFIHSFLPLLTFQCYFLAKKNKKEILLQSLPRWVSGKLSFGQAAVERVQRFGWRLPHDGRWRVATCLFYHRASAQPSDVSRWEIPLVLSRLGITHGVVELDGCQSPSFSRSYVNGSACVWGGDRHARRRPLAQDAEAGMCQCMPLRSKTV